MNIELNIEIPPNGFKQIAAFNSYALRKVGSIFLIGFAIRDEYGTILSSVAFSVMEHELLKMKDTLANYIAKAPTKPISGKFALNTFDFKSPVDVNTIHCMYNAENYAEMSLGCFSNWEINEIIKSKAPPKGVQTLNLGKVPAMPIALLHSDADVQISFIFDILILLDSNASKKGEK